MKPATLTLIYTAGVLLIVIAAVLMLSVALSPREAPPSSTPRAALALQLALLQEGDAVGLRLTVLEALREGITADGVAKAKPTFEGRTLESLVGAIEESREKDGTSVAAAKAPDGSDLTRLILVEGNWLTETLWFL